MKTTHRPYWLDRVPKARRPHFPRYRGSGTTGVAIVGAGLAGCLVAYWMVRAGLRVVLLDAGHVGEGATAASPGAVWPDPAAGFRETADALGLRWARRLWQVSRRSALELASTLRRAGGRVELGEVDALVVAAGQGDERALRREVDAVRAAGLEVAWIGRRAAERELRTTVAAAARLRRGFALDPYRAAAALAAAAARRGAAVFQESEVVRIRDVRGGVELGLAQGTLRADTVVVATGAGLTRDLKALRRHFRTIESYAVLTPPLPAGIRRQLAAGAPILRDMSAPAHGLRFTRDDRVLFSGAEQAAPGPRPSEKILKQRTGQLMYELSLLYPVISGIQPEYSWAGRHARTGDGLPVAGPHRNFPRHLFALGFSGDTLGLASAAARILARHAAGVPARGDDLLGFGRLLD